MVRIGIGYDVHRFTEGRKLLLGGIEIPYLKGLEGYSDADVVLHALCDAILGALGAGDIGQHFPDSDEKYRDIPSKKLLSKVIGILKKGKWRIGNIDTTIILQEPRLGPFKDKIRNSIAETAGIKNSQVNVKATTAEMLGPIGKGEAAASQAIVLIEK